MRGIHALVPEDASHFIHTVETADDQLFQIQLGFDTQEHVHVQRVVMCHKRLCRSSDLQRQQHRCFHFQIADAVQISTNLPQDLASGDKSLLDIRVYDQIQIPLTITGVLILQTVPLFRQGQQGLGKHGDLCCVNGNFALAGAEYEALHADNIADVPLLEFLEIFLADVVHADVYLNAVSRIPHVNEVCTSHIPPAHNASGNGDRLFFQGVQLCL